MTLKIADSMHLANVPRLLGQPGVASQASGRDQTWGLVAEQEDTAADDDRACS
jgi:hypothetical protein